MTELGMEPEFRYSERYVAFVDILGFREIIANSVKSELQVSELARILKNISERDPQVDNKFCEDFKFVQFSDSIVMSCEATQAGLDYLLKSVEDLALSLLKRGLLMRGGIAKGLMYHQDRVAFGPAFIRAYDIENLQAKFPRVVFDKTVWEDYAKFAASEPEWKRKRVIIADDGPAFVNVLRHLREVSDWPHPQNINYVLAGEGTEYANLSGILKNLLLHAMHEPNNYEKVKWFAIYWNTIVGNPAGPFEPVALPTMPESLGGQQLFEYWR